MSAYNERPWENAYRLGSFKLERTMQPYPVVPLYSFLDKTAEKYSQRPACLYLGRKISWKELKNYVDRLANALRALGVKKGDRVATILPSSPQFVISDYAIQKAGAVHVPCSLLHKAYDLIYEIGDSGAESVICLDESFNLVQSIMPRTKIKNIITTALEDFSASEPNPETITGANQLRGLIEMYPPEPIQIEINPLEDLAVLVFTGGSTGKPKGVMLTHYNLTSNTIQSLPWIMSPLQEGIMGKASILIAIPSFHAYGHWAVRSAVYWGLQMIFVPDPRDTDSIVSLLKRYRPFMATLVPTQYMRLVEKKIGRTNTMFASGAAPLPREVARRFKKETGMPVTEAYGLTETGPLTHFNLSSFARITGFMPFEKAGSIGLPIVDTEVKVVDSETGGEVAPGESGELYIRGPQVMKGYWPVAGEGLREGWLSTGDICFMDEEGYFFLVDRDKDMINVSGNKVYSTRVDEVIFELEGVAEALTIGVPDPDRPGSERVKAFVVTREEYRGRITAEAIISHCRERLAPYAVPKAVEIRDSLPMTVTGKLFKKILRDREIAKYKEGKAPNENQS